jgi:hypothetical protein
MHKLYPGISTPEAETGPCRGRVESLQWQIALRALRLQCNVVVDWGVWSRAERDNCRDEARAAGARVVLCFLDVPLRSSGIGSPGETPSFQPARSTSRGRTCLGGRICSSPRPPRSWRFTICQTTQPSPPSRDTPQTRSSISRRRTLSYVWQLSGSRAHVAKVRKWGRHQHQPLLIRPIISVPAIVLVTVPSHRTGLVPPSTATAMTDSSSPCRTENCPHSDRGY